jgi:folate-binding protein YgfZ
MMLFNLDTRDVVRIGGEGAKKLINDTLTCRFEDLSDGLGRWFALQSPQGKVLVEGLVTFSGDSYWFDVEAGVTADFMKRMAMYRLRANATIERVETHAIVWSPDGDAPSKGLLIAYGDRRGAGLGQRFILDWADLGGEVPPPREVYGQAKVEAGLLELGLDFAANEVFPHDIGMDLLDGIDFVKGCYIGQEVVSRMRHRGTARRRPVIAAGLPDGAAAGAPVMVGEREAGTLGQVVNGSAVAILRLDRIPDADAATVGGIPVKLSIPNWGTYGFGESGAAE